MSGANGIEKRLACDREERIHLKTLYPQFFSRFPNPGPAPANEMINPLNGNPDPTRVRYPLLTQTVPTTTLDAQQALNDILLTTGSSAAITGPTAAQIAALLGQLFLTSLGNGQLGANPNNERDGYVINVENSDPLVAKVITFGTGVTPSTLTVAPNTISQVAFEVTQNNPPLIRHYTLGTANTAPALTTIIGFSAISTTDTTATNPTNVQVVFDGTGDSGYFGVGYNPATGTYTAPVTGIYTLTFFGYVVVTGTSALVGIEDLTSGSFVDQSQPILASAADQLVSFSSTVAMTAGRQYAVILEPNTGGSTITLQGSSGAGINRFSAQLIQQLA